MKRRTCPKCLSGWITVRYEKTHIRERLRYTCTSCGYTWTGPCADERDSIWPPPSGPWQPSGPWRPRPKRRVVRTKAAPEIPCPDCGCTGAHFCTGKPLPEETIYVLER